MDLQNEKCVMVIDESLPPGIIANTAAIMGITLGKERIIFPPSWKDNPLFHRKIPTYTDYLQ